MACGGEGARVTVTVPAGSTLDVAIDSLAAHGVVDHAALFRVYARLRGLRGSLKSGVYLLRGHSAWSDVVDALERGRGVELRWTVPEGLMLSEVADLAAAGLHVTRDSFLTATRDSTTRADLGLPPRTATVEGSLFPPTYLGPPHMGARGRG